MAVPTASFTHTPLDLTSSKTIRLIEFLPSNNSDTSIQCRLVHATSDVQYICLSYVWGTDEPENIIHINGLPMKVRRNLWNFLQNIHERYLANISQSALEDQVHPGAYWVGQRIWIDALCIDQENTLERNHQVQQMGDIYGNAQQVVVWFGNDSRAASFIDAIRQGGDIRSLPNSQVLMRRFCEDVYWKRAWTTQEVLLARDITFLARQNEVDMFQIGTALETSLKSFGLGDAHRYFQQLYDIMGRKEDYTLMENVWRFRHKQCLDPRDIIYSLMSISQMEEDLEVDYDITTFDLALRVLHALGRNMCLCSAKVVQGALSYLKELKHKEWDVFAALHLPSSLRVDMSHPSSDYTCKRCQTKILPGIFLENYRSTLTSNHTFFYCLSCLHRGSSIRRYLIRERNSYKTPILEHGHLMLLRYGSPPAWSWKTYWISGPYGVKGPLQGVKVTIMRDDGSVRLTISSEDFALLALFTLEADFAYREIISELDGGTSTEYENPKWTLHAREEERSSQGG